MYIYSKKRGEKLVSLLFFVDSSYGDLILYYFYVYIHRFEFGSHASGDGGVGNDGVEVFGVGDEGEASFVEFGGVKDCDHL